MPAPRPPADTTEPIDARRLGGADGANAAAAAVRRAAADGGYLVLDHAFEPGRADLDLLAQMRRFFVLPDDDPRKRAVRVGQGATTHGFMPLYGEPAYQPGTRARVESFDCGIPWHDEPGVWPTLPGFRDAAAGAWRQLTAVGMGLLEVVALAAGLPRDFLRRRCGSQDSSTMRLLHYPGGGAPATEREVGISAHTDFECITLLYQTVPGLELRDAAGRWRLAPAGERRLLVLFGDMLERWTNGRLRATPHRVPVTPEPRFSIVLFFAVDDGVRVAPCAELLGPGEAPAYAPVTQREHSAAELERAARNRDVNSRETSAPGRP